MKFFAILALVAGLAGCRTIAAHAPYDIVQVTSGQLVTCAPTTDWTAVEVEQRCGEPVQWVPLFGAEVVQCGIYETRSPASTANRIAVCVAPNALRPTLYHGTGTLGPDSSDEDEPTVTRGGRRVIAVVGLRAD